MSTKIYNGMAFPLTKLEGFIPVFREKVICRVKKHIRKALANLSESKVRNALVREYGLPRNTRYPKEILLLGMMVENSKRGVSFCNFDTWFNAWIWNGNVYLYSLSDRTTPTAKDFPSWCKDFSYWNNTDKPKNVSEGEWCQRGKVWDFLTEHGERGDLYFTYNVIEAKTVNDHGTFALFSHVPKKWRHYVYSSGFFLDRRKQTKA